MAQTITGTELATTATANVRRPALAVEFQWNGTDWTDETSRVLVWQRAAESARTTAGIAVIGNSVAAKANITLSNADNRYSQFNTGGALYANIGDGKLPRIRVRIRAGFTNSSSAAELLPVFTGFVVQVHEDTIGKTVALYCEDYSLELKGRRLSTVIYTPGTVFADGTTWDGSPGSYIAELLRQVNVTLAAEGRAEISWSLDPGRYSLDFAWAEDDEVWKELIDVAEADGGRVYFDHSGVLHFEDATHLLQNDHLTSVYTFGRERYAQLMHSWEWNTPAINHVTVMVAPRYVSSRVTVYRCGETLVIKPGETITHKADFSEPVYTAVTLAANTDYVAVNAGGIDFTSSISISATRTARGAELDITNSHASETLFLTKLEIRGNPLKARSKDRIETEDAASIAQYGKQELSVNNPYIMSYRHAGALGQFLLDRGKLPKQGTELRGIPALPWLELGDRVTIQESDSGTDADYFIIRDIQGMNLSNPRDAKYVQTLTCVPELGLHPYADYFRVSVSALGTGTGKGRIFY